jgi:dipeptidyl aminopeptidase/acylaminoacyl peptidase
MPEAADFYPAWALDGDQIAYVAAERWPRGASAPYNWVDAVDITGKKRALWSYRSRGEGCGGGSSDPADPVYWQETGFGGIPPSLQWSMARHLAVYSPSCAGGLYLTDIRTNSTRALGGPHQTWNEAAISRTGILAAIASACAPVRCAHSLILVSLTSGAIIRTLAGGELPLWSPDGKILYFVKRVPGKVLRMHDAAGNAVALQTEASQIWRANGNGSQPLRLLSEDAYGFGPLNLTPDGRAIIFSRVDNDWGIWQHRLAGTRFNQAIISQFGPRVRIERFDSGRLPVTIAADAGRPAVQP